MGSGKSIIQTLPPLFFTYFKHFNRRYLPLAPTYVRAITVTREQYHIPAFGPRIAAGGPRHRRFG